MLVKCWYCKEKVEKGSNDWTSYNGHNYHIECVENRINQLKLDKFILSGICTSQ